MRVDCEYEALDWGFALAWVAAAAGGGDVWLGPGEERR